ncbi:MAG: 2-C-methyl-D-erythritol 2,4-cyclodiphosphate synthase [Actinobacteria bacterium]|nr:MAG: 2-C-methyl-D-erythritol 2,4-cyclodiphosphate synthase [Actinomycetota bacterium]
MPDLRVGIGVDAHAFAGGVPLVLGGVEIASPRGLAGHSDGDVVTHALIDALLGAAGLGDIGSLFPSDDPELRGVSSLKLLREAYMRIRSAGWKLVNADAVLIGNEPRISLLREQMQAALSAALDGDGIVTVRATTTDGLGFTGRGEGLAAQAAALLERVA